MFIQRETLFNMVGAVSKGMEELSMAMLWLASYTFLLRVPSEGLPMCRGGVGYTPLLAEQSLLYMDGDETVCLKLHARKSQPRRFAEETLLLRRRQQQTVPGARALAWIFRPFRTRHQTMGQHFARPCALSA